MTPIKFKPNGFVAKTLLLGIKGTTDTFDPAVFLANRGYNDSCRVLNGLIFQTLKILFLLVLVFGVAFCLGVGAKSYILYYLIKGTIAGAATPFIGTIWEWPAMIGMMGIGLIFVICGVVAAALAIFGTFAGILYCISGIASCIGDAKPRGLSRLIESRREKFCVPVEFKE